MITTSELKNYAFTIQIPSFKKINYKGVYQPYKDLSELEQEDFIYSTVRIILKDETSHFEIKFEKHKDGRTHAHGTIYQITNEDIEQFKESVCYVLGVKSPKQKSECCFCIPILFSHGWSEYITKEEVKEDIRDFSKYLFGKLNK